MGTFNGSGVFEARFLSGVLEGMPKACDGVLLTGAVGIYVFLQAVSSLWIVSYEIQES
jgi:hypothetical protein